MHPGARALIAGIGALLFAGALLLLRHPQPPRAPSQSPPPPPPPNVEVIRDVVFGTGGGRPLHLDIARPKTPGVEPRPVVVYVHGGGWAGGDYHNPRSYPLAAHGYFTANIEYRLSKEACFPAQIEDCKAAIRFLRAHARQYQINTDQIGVWGHSAGGHLAALLGTSGGVRELEGTGGYPEQSSAVQAVVDCYGPTDLLRIGDFPSRIPHGTPGSMEALLIGGLPQQNPKKYKAANPITYVDARDPPFLILHGESDDIVPINQSELLVGALRKAAVAVTFVRVKNAGHKFEGNTDPDPKQIEAMILAFFDKHLKASQAGQRRQPT